MYIKMIIAPLPYETLQVKGRISDISGKYLGWRYTEYMQRYYDKLDGKFFASRVAENL